MNISWVGGKTNHYLKADVMVTLVCKKTMLCIQFSQGVMATRFKHADRIMVGLDENDSMFCFAPGDGTGFKVYEGANKTGRIKVSVNHVINHCSPNSLCGDWVLKTDMESGVSYIPIGALPR